MIQTRIIKIDPLNPEEERLQEAAHILRDGGLVIMPTETVYGIGANLLNKKTLERLCEIKKRPQNKPFSLHIDKKERIEDFTQDIPTVAYKLIGKFWPGPLTLILKTKENSSIGIRLPDHEIARAIIGKSAVPIVCPSANISGKPAPVNFSEAIRDLDGLVDLAIDSGPTELQIESSVVDVTVTPPRILREGAIKKEEIESAINKKIILFVCTGNSCRSVMAKALLEKMLKEKKRNDVEVLSSGIMMLGGLGATEETKELLKKEGIDVSPHRSQGVTKDMLIESDIILVMERLHEGKILELVPSAKNRVFLLKEFAKIRENNLDIPDPIGKSPEFYAQVFAVIKEAVERVSNLI